MVTYTAVRNAMEDRFELDPLRKTVERVEIRRHKDPK